MSSTPHAPEGPNELLLPLLLPPVPPQPPEPSRPREASGERRSRQPRAGLPRPEEWVEEVLRQIQLRQGEVTQTWGSAVDVLTRQLQGEVKRLSESSARNAQELTAAMAAIEGSVATLLQGLTERMGGVQATVQLQTTALTDTVSEQGEILRATTREATAHIGVARHELSLAGAELKRRTFRHGIWLGGGTAIVILLTARLLFPFWGMQRPDMEAWSRGGRLLQTYEAMPREQQQALLRALKWDRMPGAVPTSHSTSSGYRADGR